MTKLAMKPENIITMTIFRWVEWNEYLFRRLRYKALTNFGWEFENKIQQGMFDWECKNEFKIKNEVPVKPCLI